MIRPSRSRPRWLPHFLLGYYDSTNGVIDLTSFKPIDPVDAPGWRAVLHLWFKGRVENGD